MDGGDALEAVVKVGGLTSDSWVCLDLIALLVDQSTHPSD